MFCTKNNSLVYECGRLSVDCICDYFVKTIFKQFLKNSHVLIACSSNLISWQANGLIIKCDNPTFAMDMFSFGCVLFHSLTSGHHLFGLVTNIKKYN